MTDHQMVRFRQCYLFKKIYFVQTDQEQLLRDEIQALMLRGRKCREIVRNRYL
jgi:hypothetical protein